MKAATSASPPRGERRAAPIARARRSGPAAAGPEDWGLFGPDSVSWRVHRSPVLLCGGLRALITQSFHPHAMAGVAQHSNYLERPLDRLQRTAQYVSTVVFGDTASARAAAERVKRVHLRVRGVDPITGDEYSAQDVASLLWVHCAEVHSFLASFRAYGGQIDEGEQDRYLAEQVAAAELLGVPREMVPATRAEYREYFASMRPRLCVTEASRPAIDLCVSPPLTRELLPLQAPLLVLATAAIAITPTYMRRMAGLERAGWRYVSAGAVTRAAGKLLVLPGFREAPRAAIGRCTMAVARGAIEAGGGGTVLIGPDGGTSGVDAADATPEVSGRSVLGQLLAIAFICASCWLAIGLLVLAGLMLGSGWLEPLLIAAALVVGAGLALFPATLYRDRARAAEATLDALISEAPDQALLDAGAREPRLYLRAERLGAFRRTRQRRRPE